MQQKDLGRMRLHEVYTTDEIMRLIDRIESINFITHRKQKLMVVHTESAELVFKVIDGNTVELVERN